ncbi:MAG: hypothetical protein ACI4DO_03055 [Roseburia sp.]
MHLISLGILGVGYVLTRYIFFDDHGMKQWPLVLFVCGIVIISVSFFAKAKQVPVITALSYIVGFVAGVVFQTDGVDAGGGRTNNLWIIWAVVFVCFTLASILTELIAIWKQKQDVVR